MDSATSTQVPLPRWTPDLVRELAGLVRPGDAARRLASFGIAVFPCAPGAKQPLTGRGFHDATTDVAQVERWWRRWPEANLGLPTGAPAGVDVVDVDVHTHASGYAQFARATEGHFTDRWAWLVRTPSGGLHAYFLHHADNEQRSWQAPRAHIDFRGDGGYVIAPPSRLAQPDGSSRTYEVIALAQHSPAPVDASSLRTFLEPPRTPRPPAATTRGLSPDGLVRHVATAPEGGRNQALFWAACCMAEEGHQFQSALQQLGDAAHTAGLPDAEIETTVRSAYGRTTPAPGAAPSQPSRSLSRAVTL